MAMLPVVGPFLAKVDIAVSGYVLETSGRVAAALSTPFRAMVTLYIILWGLAMWRGLIQEPLSDGIARVLRIVLVGTLALGTGVYGSRIATAIYDTPAQLASAVSGGAVSPELVMDGVIATGDEIAHGYLSLIRITDPGGSLIAGTAALLCWGFTLLAVLYGVALILLSKVALAVILGLGPIFIAMLLFDATKRFFEAWLGQALNYLFIFSLVASAAQVLFALWRPALNYALANNAEGFSALIPLVLCGGASLVVLMQVPSIASGLAGGVQVGTLGAVGWTANKALRSTGLISPRKVRGAYQAARRDALAVQTGIAMAGRTLTAPARWVAGRVRGQNSISGREPRR